MANWIIFGGCADLGDDVGKERVRECTLRRASSLRFSSGYVSLKSRRTWPRKLVFGAIAVLAEAAPLRTHCVDQALGDVK